MAIDRSFEFVAASIASLDRVAVKRHLLNFKGAFKFDFTEDYLETLSLDRLRHILLAAMSSKMRKKTRRYPDRYSESA
jgi:hypothetical protein